MKQVFRPASQTRGEERGEQKAFACPPVHADPCPSLSPAPPQLPALHHPVGKHPGLHCRTKAPMSRITRVRELCVPSRVTPPFPVGPRPGTSGGRKRALPPPRPLPAALIPPGSATGHAATGAGCRSVTIPRLLPALPPAREAAGHLFGGQCTCQLRPLPAHGEWDLHPLSWRFPVNHGPSSRGSSRVRCDFFGKN